MAKKKLSGIDITDMSLVTAGSNGRRIALKKAAQPQGEDMDEAQKRSAFGTFVQVFANLFGVKLDAASEATPAPAATTENVADDAATAITETAAAPEQAAAAEAAPEGDPTPIAKEAIEVIEVFGTPDYIKQLTAIMNAVTSLQLEMVAAAAVPAEEAAKIEIEKQSALVTAAEEKIGNLNSTILWYEDWKRDHEASASSLQATIDQLTTERDQLRDERDALIAASRAAEPPTPTNIAKAAADPLASLDVLFIRPSQD